MATSLFFKNNRKYGVGSIEFDLILSENHNYNSSVSAHPIEDGSSISDHIQNETESGTINGLITNYSLKTNEITSNRAQDVFEALIDLWKNKEVVTIKSVLKIYDNVAITSMPFMRDASQGESLPISISFQKVNIVKLQTVTLELSVNVANLNTNTNKQVSAQVNVGQTIGASK